MFGPVANSKMVSRSSVRGPAPKIRIGNSQPSSNVVALVEAARVVGRAARELGLVPGLEGRDEELAAGDREGARRLGGDLDALSWICARPPWKRSASTWSGSSRVTKARLRLAKTTPTGSLVVVTPFASRPWSVCTTSSRLRLTTLTLSERWFATSTSSSPLRAAGRGGRTATLTGSRPTGISASTVEQRAGRRIDGEHRERARRGVGDVEARRPGETGRRDCSGGS